MKQSFSAVFSITRIVTSLAFLICSALVVAGIFTFNQGGATILFTSLVSLVTGIVLSIFEHRQNLKLAELCNCPVEDIYFARNTLCWHPNWIRANVPSFYGYLLEEKRRRGLTSN